MKRELEKIAYMYGDMTLKQRRRKRQKLLIEKLCEDYAKNSTLHGLRYVTERELNAVEKTFWLVTFLASLGLCSYLIYTVYIKWTTSPIIFSMDEKLVSVGSVPFPAVTICPQVKTDGRQYQLKTRLNLYKNILESDLQTVAKSIINDTADELKDISMLCNYNMNIIADRNYTSSIYTSMDSRLLTNYDIIEKCYWQNSEQNCDSMLSTAYTAEGKCFTLNGLSFSEIVRDRVSKELELWDYYGKKILSRGWSTEKGYSNSEKNPYPRRGNINRARPDLQLVLHTKCIDRDPLCNGLKSGYNVYLHHPADLPQASLYHYSATDDRVTSLAVSVHVQSTADSLAGYSPEVRQCYIPEERYLRYFKVYTAKNCELECLSNITYDRCDCVAFYMPHEDGTNICAEKKLDCMREAQREMEERELNPEPEQLGCRCLPTCYNVEYDAEVLKTDFVTANYEGEKKMASGQYCDTAFGCYIVSNEISHFNISVIEVYFKKSQFVAFRRSELFGTTDFLANIGGLLGVFLGFSFLSLIEIIYYLTLKLTLMLKRDIEQEKMEKYQLNNKSKY